VMLVGSLALAIVNRRGEKIGLIATIMEVWCYGSCRDVRVALLRVRKVINHNAR